MDQIRQAVERAKTSGVVAVEPHKPSEKPQKVDPITQAVERVKASATTGPEPNWLHEQSVPIANVSPRFKKVTLDGSHLERHRIISHSAADPRSKAFDILRTQVLQSMDQRNWQFIAVTSPTSGCGKTVTAINLALSIARQPERSVLLVDMDLPRPAIADCLGIKCKHGLLGILEGRTTLAEALVEAQIDGCEALILPTEAPTVRSSELIGSRTMNTVLQDIRRTFGGHTVIFDMPPALSSDDVIAMLPKIDCVLLVAAVSTSTVHEIKECNKLLQSAHVVRLILNKAHEQAVTYS